MLNASTGTDPMRLRRPPPVLGRAASTSVLLLALACDDNPTASFPVTTGDGASPIDGALPIDAAAPPTRDDAGASRPFDAGARVDPDQDGGEACATDADCRDGLYCNGAERCVDGSCLPAS